VKTILIVEDDPISAHAYRRALERAGFVVHVAADGQAGLEWIERFRPDGMLLDLMMPRTNGIEVLKAVRALHHLAQIPILVYTNAFIPNLVDEARAAGATEVYSKSTLTPEMTISTFRAVLD
jgi:CheY-like chemotaxis protein